jgi:hypothetical protein
MGTWEYARILASQDSRQVWPKGYAIWWLGTAGSEDLSPMSIVDALNRAGRDGWEVVALGRRFNAVGTSNFPDEWDYTLKRIKRGLT